MSFVAERVLEQLQLDRLLDDQSFTYDVRQGVLYNPANTRCCLLSTDLLNGIYRALLDEAGEAWTIIFKRCGLTWGQRLARRLERELQALFQVSLSDVPVGQFLQTMNRYFAFHGWGDLRINVDQAPTRGVVEASLRDSIFLEVIKDSPEMVDWLMSGILASLFSHLSGQQLDCIQTACVSKGAALSTFLISTPARIQNAAQPLAAGSSHSDLLGSI